MRSEEHTSELQSRLHLVCRLLLEKKKKSTYSLCPLIILTYFATATYFPLYSLICLILFFCIIRHYTLIFFFFFFNDTATTEIYTLSLHDALPIWFSNLEHGGRPRPNDSRIVDELVCLLIFSPTHRGV